MATSSKMVPFLVLFLAAASTLTAVHASSGDGGLTHINLFIHEKDQGANATAMTVVTSPLGANATFGSIAVYDDVLRVGQDPTSEQVGNFQGIIVGTAVNGSANYLTSINLVFTAGQYNGSSLTVEGAVLGFTGTIERPVVGGAGMFRMARGYSLLKVVAHPTSETVIFEIDLFVLMPRGKY